MKKFVLIIMVVLMSISLNGAEAKQQRILLQDKSVIMGQVLELKEGQYTIRTETMGEIKLAADKILEISSLEIQATSSRPAKEIAIRDGSKKQAYSSPPVSSSNANAQQDQVNSRVRSMAMDGDFLDSMMDLSQAGSMLDVMSDPEVMDAINRNDYDFLMNSEKMKNLMGSPEIRELLGDFE